MHRSYACSSAARLSAHRCPVVGLPLVCRWSAVGLPLVCHACIARLSPRLSAGLPLSCRWYIAALSARVVVAALSARLLLVAGLLSARPSLVCHLSVAVPSPRVVVAALSARLLLVAGLLSARPSLVCHLSVAVPSPRVVVAALSARLLLVAALPLVCRSAAPLGCSTRLLYCSTRLLYCSTRLLYCSTRLLHCSTRLLYCSTPLALHSYSICWLRLAATLFTHTLSHAWCPVTLLSLTRCSTVVVTVVVASCSRTRDSIGSIGAVARCVVAVRLPPSAISVTVQHRNAVHRRIQQMGSVS